MQHDMYADMHERVGNAVGFIAALDQSGGSTPGALATYGIDESQYGSTDKMFDLVHAMRSRIITSASFGGDRILGAILFEMTMDREIDGVPTAEYLWTQKQVVPFIKVDKGLAEAEHGAQMMKPNPDLAKLLARAKENGIYGTKMRSFISNAVVTGIAAVVQQQFEIGQDILSAGLMPIIEPEVSIACVDKAEAEVLLREQILANLDQLDDDQSVMLKLTLPDVDNLYADVIVDPRVHRVVALSGGYSRGDANRRLTSNTGMIASFSRALAEGLSHDQPDDVFDQVLDESIAAIFKASST